MSDEGFHEIQLNGKQLVFLFMAATVVAVVIFLCGVMVGRGVPTRAAAPIDAPQQAALDPTAPLGVPAADLGGPATQTLATDNGPITAQETLTYPTLLEDPNPPAETLAPIARSAARSRASGDRAGRGAEAATRRAEARERRAEARDRGAQAGAAAGASADGHRAL